MTDLLASFGLPTSVTKSSVKSLNEGYRNTAKDQRATEKEMRK